MRIKTVTSTWLAQNRLSLSSRISHPDRRLFSARPILAEMEWSSCLILPRNWLKTIAFSIIPTSRVFRSIELMKRRTWNWVLIPCLSISSVNPIQCWPRMPLMVTRLLLSLMESMRRSILPTRHIRMQRSISMYREIPNFKTWLGQQAVLRLRRIRVL